MKTPVLYIANRLEKSDIFNLMSSLEKILNDQFFMRVLHMELAHRRDAILDDESISNDGKVEAIKQLVSLTSLFSPTMLKTLKSAGEGKNKETNVSKEKLREDLKKRTLKQM